ncbi:MAG: hypothetical protein ACYTGX_06185 [Planctomycetota bacterium]|jgi:hypothetical protein
MDPLEKLLHPGERLLSFFRAVLDRIGDGIIVLTDQRILWVTESGNDVEFDPSEISWVARNENNLRITVSAGSFSFELGSEAAAASAASYVHACVETAKGVPLSDETSKFNRSELERHAKSQGVDLDEERRKLQEP